MVVEGHLIDDGEVLAKSRRLCREVHEIQRITRYRHPATHLESLRVAASSRASFEEEAIKW
jgi:hypothetical protein